MSEPSGPETNGHPPSASESATRALSGEAFGVSAKAFEEQFAEDLLRTLDVETWRVGGDLDAEYRRMEWEVREAQEFETDQERRIREDILPRLVSLPNMPKNAGLHSVSPEDIALVHRGLLFNGGVEACDGATLVHDTLPLTIYQIGVCLVSYRGNQGAWGQRLFRRDLRQKGIDLDELFQFLELRALRESGSPWSGQDQLGELVQKVLLDYAERAILLRRSQARWRLGHGNPVTYELLTGGGNLELMVQATAALRDLVEKHQRFIFVASQPRDRLQKTLGQALRPGEYAITGTLEDHLSTWLHQDRFVNVSTEVRWDEELISPAEWIPRFIKRVASQIVVGLFRPTLFSHAQLFYAHVDHSEVAAHIVLADCMLKEQGNSLLLELARQACVSNFGESLEALAESAYIAVGDHHRFFAGQSRRVH